MKELFQDNYEYRSLMGEWIYRLNNNNYEFFSYDKKEWCFAGDPSAFFVNFLLRISKQDAFKFIDKKLMIQELLK